MGKGWLALLLVVVLSLASLGEELLQIWHLDVGQADSTLLLSPSGTVILFDCGETHYRSSANAEYVANRIVELTGKRHIDYFVLSHLHLDHAGYVGEGGFWHLIEEEGFSIGTLISGDLFTYRADISDDAFTAWCDYINLSRGAAEQWQIGSLDPDGNEVSLDDGVTLTVCSVDGNGLIGVGSRGSANDLSLGILVSYGDYQEWIGGDLGGVTTGKYIDIETSSISMIGDVEVLRVNHHGSAYSTNDTFLESLDPEVSIISVGEGKSYGHPGLDVLIRLARTSDVYMTTSGNRNGAIADGSFCLDDYRNVFPDSGDILIETNGETYRVNGRAYPTFP